jgi:DNA-directed RNA polymerase specialized sigma subunit
MIRNNAEYKEAVTRLKAEKSRMTLQESELKKSGLAKDEIKRVMDPMISFHFQLKEEIESYERLLDKDFDELSNLHGLGRYLIAFRIASGKTQRELAELLNVSESQVSRDERNEYHGVSVERASHILDKLGVSLLSYVDKIKTVPPKRKRAAGE